MFRGRAVKLRRCNLNHHAFFSKNSPSDVVVPNPTSMVQWRFCASKSWHVKRMNFIAGKFELRVKSQNAVISKKKTIIYLQAKRWGHIWFWKIQRFFQMFSVDVFFSNHSLSTGISYLCVLDCCDLSCLIWNLDLSQVGFRGQSPRIS